LEASLIARGETTTGRRALAALGQACAAVRDAVGGARA
jgi:hypothetical protein